MNTRRTCLGRVRQYCAYLETSANDYGDPLNDPYARDYAIRDCKSHLKKERKAKPASVKLMLAALDHFYLFLGLGRPKVRREDLPQEAPKALLPEAQKRFLRAVERCTSVRDRALALAQFREWFMRSTATNAYAVATRKYGAPQHPCSPIFYKRSSDP